MQIGLGNRVFYLQKNLKGADWSRHIFVQSATAMALNKNPAMPPSSSDHCGQYDTTYATLGGTLQEVFADDTILGDKREPARWSSSSIYFHLLHHQIIWVVKYRSTSTCQ